MEFCIKNTLLIGLSVLLYSCNSGKNGFSAVKDDCTDLPKLNWMKEEDTVNSYSLISFIARASDAAKEDIDSSLNAVGNGVQLKSRFAQFRKLNGSSSVSEDFWEQDIAFRQMICFLDKKISQKNLSSDFRKECEKRLFEWIDFKKTYLEQRQKKKI